VTQAVFKASIEVDNPEILPTVLEAVLNEHPELVIAWLEDHVDDVANWFVSNRRAQERAISWIRDLKGPILKALLPDDDGGVP